MVFTEHLCCVWHCSGYFAFSQRFSQALEIERLELKSYLPPGLFSLSVKSHIPRCFPKATLKAINTRVQEYRWSPEPEPVTLLEMNNPALQTFWSLLRWDKGQRQGPQRFAILLLVCFLCLWVFKRRSHGPVAGGGRVHGRPGTAGVAGFQLNLNCD